MAINRGNWAAAACNREKYYTTSKADKQNKTIDGVISVPFSNYVSQDAWPRSEQEKARGLPAKAS